MSVVMTLSTGSFTRKYERSNVKFPNTSAAISDDITAARMAMIKPAAITFHQRLNQPALARNPVTKPINNGTDQYGA